MSVRTRIGLVLALLLLGVAAALFRPGEARRTERFPVMGTIAAVSLEADPEAAERGIAAVRADFDRVVELCNLRDPESELSRLNAAAATAPFVCSPELWEIITQARAAWRISGGAFDPTVKPLMDLWGFYRKRGETAPEAGEIAGARELVGLDKVEFDDAARSVRFLRSGMAFDFGGIAKGYAVDRAAERLEQLGFHRGLVDLGGNIRGLSDGEYRVGITDPSHPDLLTDEIITLHGSEAVASSGDYQRFVVLGGVRYGHIIDPASGVPPAPDYAVTVVAPTAVAADWLSTSAFLRGPEFSEIAGRECGARLVFVDKER